MIAITESRSSFVMAYAEEWDGIHVEKKLA